MGKIERFFMDDLISLESSGENYILEIEIYRKEKERFFLFILIPAHWTLKIDLEIVLPHPHKNIKLAENWYLAKEGGEVASFLPLSEMEKKSLMSFILEKYLEGEINISLIKEKIIEIGRSRKK